MSELPRLPLGLLSLLLLAASAPAFALPAFAIRESAPCALCHENGSAPHLTRYGFMYRRAGYRNPGNIGVADSDKDAMHLTDHTAVGVNADYEFATSKPNGGMTTTTANQFDARELEIWPLVGALQGDIGVFSEIDASPAATPKGGGVAAGGGVSMTHGELVYVRGDIDLFFTLRAGLIATQGFGAGDQWLDDGNLPLIDALSHQFNQDSLVIPLGANNAPQMGSELGLSWNSATYLTIGTYNGYDGTSGLATKTQSTLNPVVGSGAKDAKAQVDQFLGEGTELTGIYYKGTVALLDPSNSEVWQNHFDTWRIYVTQRVGPIVDLLGGAANGSYEYREAAPSETTGKFSAPGGFLGLNLYATEHVTASARYDYFESSRLDGSVQRVRGTALMLGVPMGNTLVNFHVNVIHSDLDGQSADVRAEWRLLF